MPFFSTMSCSNCPLISLIMKNLLFQVVVFLLFSQFTVVLFTFCFILSLSFLIVSFNFIKGKILYFVFSLFAAHFRKNKSNNENGCFEHYKLKHFIHVSHLCSSGQTTQFHHTTVSSACSESVNIRKNSNGSEMGKTKTNESKTDTMKERGSDIYIIHI